MGELSSRDFFRIVAVSVAIVIGLQHTFYALSGGVHQQPLIAVALTLVALAGGVLFLLALRGYQWPAWIGLVFIWIPLVVTYPVPFLSIGGLLYVLLVVLATVAFIVSLLLPNRRLEGPSESSS